MLNEDILCLIFDIIAAYIDELFTDAKRDRFIKLGDLRSLLNSGRTCWLWWQLFRPVAARARAKANKIVYCNDGYSTTVHNLAGVAAYGITNMAPSVTSMIPNVTGKYFIYMRAGPKHIVKIYVADPKDVDLIAVTVYAVDCASSYNNYATYRSTVYTWKGDSSLNIIKLCPALIRSSITDIHNIIHSRSIKPTLGGARNRFIEYANSIILDRPWKITR